MGYIRVGSTRLIVVLGYKMNTCSFVLLLAQTLCLTICCFILGTFGKLGFVLKLQLYCTGVARPLLYKEAAKQCQTTYILCFSAVVGCVSRYHINNSLCTFIN